MAQELKSREDAVIAQGMLTNSKHPSAFVEGVYPTHITTVDGGCFVIGNDGRRYIDMICGLGAISVGYKTAIDIAACNHVLQNGITHSLSTPAEINAAEFLLSEFLPMYDRVKYLKTGNEATLAAVRIARAATGKKWVCVQGYHGHGDLWTCLNSDAVGCPDQHYVNRCDDLDDLAGDMLSHTAAVICEPILLENSPRNTEKLTRLVERCREAGVITIFDEIVSGARITDFAISSIVRPDLVCLGKGIANGWPLSCVVGKKELMDLRYFVSSTFAGEAASLTAHLETMKHIKKHGLDGLYRQANATMQFVNEHLKEFGGWLEGYGTRAWWRMRSADELGLIWQELAHCGVLTGRSWFYNYSHLAFDAILRSQIEDAARRLRNGSQLKGKIPREALKRL